MADTVALSYSGSRYTAAGPLLLRGGDTNNDHVVDIVDFTWLSSQWGETAEPGGCAWDGTTRDADFDNGGAVGIEDYTSVVGNWLQFSVLDCTTDAHASEHPQRSVPVHDARTAAADLTGDGVVDRLDVAEFGRRLGVTIDGDR